MTKTQTPPPAVSSVHNLHHHLNHLSPSIVPSSAVVHPRLTASSGAIRKPRRALSPATLRQRAAEKEEMQSLLAKLQQLVPGIPKKRRLPKLEIIQHVIDYIFDLQVALEEHPIAGSLLDLSSWPVELGPVPMQFVTPSEHHQNMSEGQQQNSNICPLPSSAVSSSLQSCDYSYQRINSSRPERQPLASIML